MILIEKLEDRLSEVSSEWEIIRDEMDKIPKEKLYRRVNSKYMTYGDSKKWLHYVIKYRGLWGKNALVEMPKTIEMLKRVEGMYRATITTLIPKADVGVHRGEYQYGKPKNYSIYKYHLCLDMHDDDYEYMGLAVKNEVKRWRVGNHFMFCDDDLHNAWHHGKHPRTILIVDIKVDH